MMKDYVGTLDKYYIKKVKTSNGNERIKVFLITQYKLFVFSSLKSTVEAHCTINYIIIYILL